MSKIITQKDIGNTVTIRNGQEVVRSDKLASMFGKQHKNILAKIRDISEELSADFSANKIREFFVLEEGAKSQGGTFSRFYLTRKGFDLVGLSLTGKKALQYKLWYIDCFHDKQRVIKEHKLTAKLNETDDLWLQFRAEGKVFRNKLTEAIQTTVIPQREKESKFNDGKYYYHYTQLIYKVLGIELPKGTNPRDVLDKRMLVRLEDLEDKVADMITKSNKHYKDTFKEIKKDING